MATCYFFFHPPLLFAKKKKLNGSDMLGFSRCTSCVSSFFRHPSQDSETVDPASNAISMVFFFSRMMIAYHNCLMVAISMVLHP